MPGDRRRRAMGRQGTRGEGVIHAQIPVEVLESEAYRAMPDYAVRVLIALASEYRGANNGDLSLPLARARRQGIRTQWKVSVGIALLEQVGLIERMRIGHISRGKGVSALFALGWRETDPSPKYDRALRCRQPAPNRWAAWTKPADWKEIEKRYKHKAQGKDPNAVSTRVKRFAPPECIDDAQFPSTRVSDSRPVSDKPGLLPSRSGPGAARISTQAESSMTRLTGDASEQPWDA